MRILDASHVAGQTNPGQRPEPGDDLGKDDFMRLLMTQMSTQDPLSPMDNTQFVAQLTQFANLERLDNMAASLEDLAMSQVANTSAQMVSFIGQSVRVSSADINVTGEPDASYDIGYRLGGDAETVEVVVRNDAGRVVRTIEVGSQAAGEHALTWDGLDDDGNPVPEGDYSVSIHAEDGDENPVGASTRFTREVVGVSFEDGFPMLVLEGGTKVTLGDVIGVNRNE